MSDTNPFAYYQHADYVETVDLAWPAVAIDPNARGARKLTLFAPIDRFDRIAEVSPAPTARPAQPSRLYLDERHEPVPLDYEVDISMTRAESALEHAPTGSLQPTLGDSLPEEAKLSAFLRHAATIAE